MTNSEKELRSLLCSNCFVQAMNWSSGLTSTPFVPCDRCLPKLGEWLKSKGIEFKKHPSPRVDSSNPFQHPEKRKWHPQAVPFSHLLMLVISDHSSQDNAWKDDVIYYLKWWAEQKENKETGRDDVITLSHLIKGLRSLADRLEGK